MSRSCIFYDVTERFASLLSVCHERDNGANPPGMGSGSARPPGGGDAGLAMSEEREETREANAINCGAASVYGALIGFYLLGHGGSIIDGQGYAL